MWPISGQQAILHFTQNNAETSQYSFASEFSNHRKSSSTGDEKGKRAPSDALSPTFRSGRKHLRSKIPQPTIQPHVLPNGRDAPRARQPAIRRPPAQAATEEILLALIQGAPQVVSNVFSAPAGQKLRRLHRALRRVRKPKRQRRF